MSQWQDPRLPSPAQAGRGSDEAPIGLTSFNRVGAASSAFGNEPQELLGLSAGPTPMAITSSIPGTLARSSAPERLIYTSQTPSDYHFANDLDLADPQGSQENWAACQETDCSNDNVADALQRLASAEPEQLPWSGIHLNGVPPSQRPKGLVQKPPSPDSRNPRIGRQRSTIGSHANETDEGYYTYSQPDLRSMYSDDTGQMHQARQTDQSSIPRTMPSTQGQPEFVNYSAEPFHRVAEYQATGPMEQQNSSQPPQDPLQCTESGCTFTCKTQSDFKKHTARHTREHVCSQPKCLRAEKGFATINDLERHQKTVHGIEPSHGQSRMYKCFSPNCKQAEKEWPRLDNFKQHLVRMHKSEDTQGLIGRSNDWYDMEKKPSQPASGMQSRDQRYGFLQPLETSPSRPQVQNHLSANWQPTASLARLPQPPTRNRPRHSSFSSQPNPSPCSSPFSGLSLRDSRGHNMSSIGGNQHDRESGIADPSQWSSDILPNYSHQMPHGRITSAYTVPNPDTSAISDLPDMSCPSYPEGLTTAQDDLAQIASNFPLEQQRNLSPSDPDLPAPPTPAGATRQSSQKRTFPIDVIRALVGGSASGYKREYVEFLERIMKAGIEKLKESQRPSATATTTTTTTSSSSSSSPSIVTSTLTSGVGSYRCYEAHCTKAFPRPCDLKKHLKRHHRPYGCTFSTCSEKFGSKYDWKRHETSRHFQRECWRCPLCSAGAATHANCPSTSSARLFYNQRLYEDHLQIYHGSSRETIREYVRKQRIGRNCRSTFWCGFCEKIVVLREKGLNGANERFNHIDDHFKKKRRIESWVGIDGTVAKGQQEVERDDEDDEESVEDVLGGDGISGGEVNRGDENDDEDNGEGDSSNTSPNLGAGTAQIGQKRAAGSAFDLSLSSAGVRPTHRRRRARTTHLVICDQCGNGPWVLEQSKQCVICHHLCCNSCTYLEYEAENLASST